MKINEDHLKLDSKSISGLPIVNHFMSRLNLADALDKFVPSKPNMAFKHSEAIALFVRNILIERQPLYNLAQWSKQYDVKWIGLEGVNPKILNDDRIGRSLNALFEADRASLMTEIVLNMLKEFNLDATQFHNDSTSLTVHGNYNGDCHLRGKKSIKLTLGHNKDHRPDLKQLVFCLTVSRDGAVPIHYKAYDGNVTDDRTHIQTWETLRRLTGKTDFIYIADCKLCTREQMDHITGEGGKFVTVLPKTRSEQKWFREWAQKTILPWQEIYRTPNHRRPDYGEEFVYHGFESPLPSKEGYRIIWILSSQKQLDDQDNRQRQIEKSIDALDILKQKIGKRTLCTKEQISEAVNSVLEHHHSEKWFSWQIISEEVAEFKQKRKGRPGKNTQYFQHVKTRYSIVAMPNEEAIQNESKFDGIFPLITNIKAEELPLREILVKYKYQPFIEKRFEQLKTVFEATPIELKARHRIEALMFIYFIVLMINALIERELRLKMKERGIKKINIYPEERLCRNPTTERILAIFQNQRRHVLKNQGNSIKTFNDELTELHDIVLKLVGVKRECYTK
jgi:transposase